MVKYKPNEFELAAIRERFRAYHPNLNLNDYEIQVDFEHSGKAYIHLGMQQFRFEKEYGRWVCTRGIQD